jgi:hypothetical protein
MRTAFFALALLVSSWVVADEARPVYVEVVENKTSQFLVKWKVPPVMPAGQEPYIRLQHPDCRVVDGANAAGLIGRRLYQCDIRDPDATFALQLDYPRSNPALTSLIVFKPFDAEPIQVFSGPEKTTVSIPVSTSADTVAKQYTVAGIEHILIGTDHLLFVLCLMIIAGSFKRLLLTVTGFTIAHSITLTLATLDIFRLPTELVELLIALSIVSAWRWKLLSIIELKRCVAPSFTWRYPVSASSAFGLLHGFGFRGGVAGAWVCPRLMKVHALLFFNIGVELGQLLFIAQCWCWYLCWCAQLPPVNRHRAVFVEAVVYVVGITSAYWLFERFGVLF